MACSTRRSTPMFAHDCSPTIETGAASIDGPPHIPFFSGVRDDADETPDCPWCAALRETGPPPTAQRSGPSGRRHDPYVSGAQYDDW
ncbi:hypothetical protein [Streptomyces sp. NPDC059010]|uniref:hypothetical protein n=1 Tax=Streptomyces sp. NPDC059010 TaxID=3346695 RepID=UPI00367DAD1E